MSESDEVVLVLVAIVIAISFAIFCSKKREYESDRLSEERSSMYNNSLWKKRLVLAPSMQSTPYESRVVKPPEVARHSSKKTKTQCHGKDRMWGEFYCPGCKHYWSSGNSWANCGQKCVKCDIMVYPFIQRQLDKNCANYDSKKPHLSHLCEKCIRLGRNCSRRDLY